jgi:hypothetical protein
LLFVKPFVAICHGRLFCDLFNLVLSGLVIIATWSVQSSVIEAMIHRTKYFFEKNHFCSYVRMVGRNSIKSHFSLTKQGFKSIKVQNKKSITPPITDRLRF